MVTVAGEAGRRREAIGEGKRDAIGHARDTAGNIVANVCPHEACMFVESDKLKRRVN